MLAAQSLRDFVGGVSTPEGLSAESVATGGDVLSWVQDGLIDAAFSDSKCKPHLVCVVVQKHWG